MDEWLGRRKLKINVSKTMKCTRGLGGRRMNVALKLLEVMECFKYLGSMITIDRGIEAAVKSMIGDIGKVLGGIRKVLSCRTMGMNV